MSDTAKLQKFVEAALTNPQHPVYRLGMQQSPILQHYAVNVSLLGSVTADEWFKQYPEHAAKLTEVMKLCEDEQSATANAPQMIGELAAIKAELAALKAKLAAEKRDPKDTEDDEPDKDEAPESTEAGD